MEEWKKCIDHNDKYYVSNLGRVKGPKGIRKLQSRKIKGTWRVILKFKIKNIPKHIKVCHLVLHYFDKPRPEKYTADQIDKNGKNNHINNLRWASRKTQDTD